MKQRLKGIRPRIGVDLHVLEGIHQGSRTHCFELFSRVIRRLPEMDFRLFVDTSRWDKSQAAFFAAPNAEVVSMPHANPIARLAVHLPRLAKEHQLDLLHTQYICPLTGDTPNAVTIHDILFEEYPEYFETFMRYRSKFFFRRSAKKAEMVFTVSEYSKRELIKRYGVSAARVTTILNGVDHKRFFPGSEGADEVAALGLEPGNYLLTVGRLEPRKNHLGMLQAMARLPSPRPKLLIVGQRDFGFEKIFELRKALHLEEDVKFLETVNSDLLTALYRNCKAFVYATFAEGFGMPVIEAMASGAVVITSNTTSLPEIAGGAALLVDPGSVESISDAISRVLDDPQLRSEMRAKGLLHSASFGWGASVEILAAAYQAHFA